MALFNIDELIKECGYNRSTLAQKMGTTKQNLYSKLKSPSYTTLQEIATALNVPMWRLFASYDEVMSAENINKHQALKCPKCGANIKINIELD